MLGHVEVDDAPTMVSEHDENEEDAQAHGGHREEIEGDQVPDIVSKERPPGLGPRGASLWEQAGDGALGHIDAELEKLAMDSRGAPERVRRGHAGDQGRAHIFDSATQKSRSLSCNFGRVTVFL